MLSFMLPALTGRGVIRAAEKAGIWAIGVDSNQNHLAPNNMLTSMIKRIDRGGFFNFEPGVG